VTYVPPFLAGGGEATRMICARDWTRHPLGPPEQWPEALRVALSLVLNSPESMILAWGKELHFFFNEAYFPLLGPRLPTAMGARLDEVWADAWDQAKPIIADAMEGRSKRFIDLPWKLDTDRGQADTFWTFSYSRVLDADGAPAGLFIFTNETTDRVQSDARLRESEALLKRQATRQQHSLQQMPGFVAVLSGPDHVFDYVNDAYRTIAGDRDFIGRGVREIFPDLAGQGYFELLDQVYQTGEPFSARAIPVKFAGDDDDRFIDLLYQPVRDDSGAVIGIFVGGYDISERVRAERALREREERYRTLFNGMDEGFCIIEFFDGPHGPLSDYLHIEANPAYARHAGIAGVVGQKLREMVGDEADGWVELYGAVLRTGEPLRFERELVQTGRVLEVSSFRIEPASLNQVAVLFQDITARKRAENALTELNATLEKRVAQALAERKVLADIVEGTNAFVQVVDLDFNWLAINSAAVGEFERIFGLTPQVGHNMLRVLAGQPAHQAAVRNVWARALAGEDYIAIGEFGDATRNRRHYEMHFSVLRNAHGQQIGAYQFVYDVSDRLLEQKRLADTEEALRQAQKMEAVGQLTGGLAHDFNNLLAGISGSLELMQARMRQGRVTEIDRYITAAQGAARRAAALTHRLLAFSRRQTLAPKPTNVNALISGMEDLIRRTVGPSIKLETIGAAGLWPALVDPPQLENALLNLCINARDAMPEGGNITVETANKWLDERGARSHDMPPGQYLSLCVTDTGTGMTPDVIAKAFDPFFTTKPIGEGTGLGLSMIYGFARQSGGQVRIYSEVGKGSTVCIYLPRHYGDTEEDVDVDTSRPARALQGETVLIVDDEPTVRMLVTEVLEELGYTAIEAADSVAGLRVLQSDVRIDLLISDVGLPGGMNGRQMADAARQHRPKLKVLFITGYAENAILGHGHLEPGMQVMTKPFVLDALAARIKEMIATG
jgi:PAS domain S-box-containing protein